MGPCVRESQLPRINASCRDMKHKVKDNEEKVKLNRALPYLGEHSLRS